MSEYTTWENAVQWLIDQPDQQEIVYSCYFDQPLDRAAYRYWKSSEWQAIKKLIPSTKGKVLDLGAGNGIASYALAKDNWEVYALEPDPSNLVGRGSIAKLAQDTKLPINIISGTGENIPCKAAFFDLIFARQALHHAQNLEQLCKDMYRVLKPGGILITVRDHVISSKKDLPNFFEIHPLHKFYGGENAYLLKEYLEAFKLAQFQINQIIYPFDNIINYAPFTKVSLKEELQKRFDKLPIGKIASQLFLNNQSFPYFLKFLSKIDRRPGRLFSFVCSKAEK